MEQVEISAEQHQPVAERISSIVPREVEPIRCGLRDSANDMPARFVRTPELDTRTARGDLTNANAWHEVATGQVRYFCRGYDANAGRWLSLDDAEGRARVDGGAA